MLWFLGWRKESPMAKAKTLLREEQWQKIEPLLPKFKRSGKGGRKPVENRPVFEGIL
jgi:transposase